MNSDNVREPRQHAARKLQARVGDLTDQLLAAVDYDSALGIASELFDSVQALLEQLRTPERTRLQ